MKSRLSGLMDGEVDAQEAAAVLDAVKRDPDLRACWQHYQLIGDALRGERSFDGDITRDVMDALGDEPVVLAPRRREPAWQRTVLALAASVAGVALVSWVALGTQDAGAPNSPPVAAAPAPAAIDAVAVAAPSASMQEYLVAHQAQTGKLRFRGGTENIRTVAVGRGVPGR